MKKFHQVVGKFFLQAVGFVCVVAATSVIVVSYYEDEKEQIFFELSNYLEALEDRIQDENQIFDAQDLKDIDSVKYI